MMKRFLAIIAPLALLGALGGVHAAVQDPADPIFEDRVSALIEHQLTTGPADIVRDTSYYYVLQDYDIDATLKTGTIGDNFVDRTLGDGIGPDYVKMIIKHDAGAPEVAKTTDGSVGFDRTDVGMQISDDDAMRPTAIIGDPFESDYVKTIIKHDAGAANIGTARLTVAG